MKDNESRFGFAGGDFMFSKIIIVVVIVVAALDDKDSDNLIVLGNFL